MYRGVVVGIPASYSKAVSPNPIRDFGYSDPRYFMVFLGLSLYI
jgi:hypothetical protein